MSVITVDLFSRSGVSSTLILRNEVESSVDKLLELTACEPYPLELVDGVLAFGANSASESNVFDVRRGRLILYDRDI